MNILQACGIALSLLLFLVQVGRGSGVDTRSVVFAAAVLFLSVSMSSLKEIVSIFDTVPTNDVGYDVLWKTLGIGMIGQFTSEICRDAGEPVLAGRVEFFAKVEIILLSLPLVRQILSLAGQMTV